MSHCESAIDQPMAGGSTNALVDSATINVDMTQFFSGTHEVQECIEGQSEADLHTHLVKCKKNPGHKGFIPVTELRLDHFPSSFMENDIYELTKALSDLTVRIAVNFTSPDRPEFITGTKDPYPFYSTRGKNTLRTGTGRACNVIKYTPKMPYGLGTYRTCPCPECDHSDTPSKLWWLVEVMTARHVVFDDSEARQSRCRLWYDADKSPVVNIDGWIVAVTAIKGDWCWLCCATHDLQVAVKLEEMVLTYNELRESVSDIHQSRRDVDKLTIIVSNPHGCCKQVSVGHWVHREEMDNMYRYSYTTCTCPGSSGLRYTDWGVGGLFIHTVGGLKCAVVWGDWNVKLCVCGD